MAYVAKYSEFGLTASEIAKALDGNVMSNAKSQYHTVYSAVNQLIQNERLERDDVNGFVTVTK